MVRPLAIRMLAVIGIAIALLATGHEARAMWAKMSEAELVATSPLIVVGTLEEITRLPRAGDGAGRTVGVIRIERVLKGDSGARVARIALPDPDGPAMSTDLHYRAGQTGLWFLRVVGDAGGGPLFAADHPQRFVPADRAAAMIETLRGLLGD